MQPGKEKIDPVRLSEAQAEIARNGALWIKNSIDGLHILDSEGFLLEMSDSFCKLLGYTRPEMEGMHVTQWESRWSPADFEERLSKLLASERNPQLIFETLHQHRDGHLFPVEIRATAIRLDSGVFFYNSTRDITNRKNRDLELIAAKNHLKSTLDAIPDLLFEVDNTGRFHLFHSNRVDLLVQPPEFFLGKTMAEVLPPEVARIGLEALAKTDLTGATSGEYVLDFPSGKRWFEFSAVRKKTVQKGEEPRFILLSRDVTDRKMAESKARRLSEFNTLLAQANQAMAESAEEPSLHQTICDLAVRYGGGKLAWIGKPDESGRIYVLAASGETGFLETAAFWVDPAHAQSMDLASQCWRTGVARYHLQSSDELRDERAFRFGLQNIASLPIRRSGSLWGMLMLYQGLSEDFDPDLQPVLEELALDISRGLDRLDGRRREQDLAAVREALIDSTVSGIILVQDRIIRHANLRLAQMLGYSGPEQIFDQSTRILYADSAEYDRIGIASQGLSKGDHLTIPDVRLRRRDGSLILCDLSASPIHNQDKETFVVTIQDVSDRHRQTERLKRLSDFNALLAKANEAIATITNESTLLQDLCRLAIVFGRLDLAWIGRPDETGIFRFLAASGQRGYLEGIRISSDKEITEGCGPAGNVWRTGRPVFNASFDNNLSPWIERADQFGLKSSAVLPIFRDKVLWAVLTVYHRDAHAFNPDLQTLLEELAKGISRGLDRLDLLGQQKILSNAMASIGEGVTITDSQQRVVYANEAFNLITGYLQNDILGKNMRILQGPDTDPAIVGQMRQNISSGREFHGQILNYRKDGSPFWNLLTINPVRDESGTILQFVGVQRDISAMVELNRQLEYESLHDRLTDLPNRRSLEIHLVKSIARAKRNKNLFAVGLIDIDDFKPVNDTLGHEAGDRLLRELARRFASFIRENDFIARLGGDEFIVVIEDLDPEQAFAQVSVLLDRLHNAVERDFEILPGQRISIGISMGLALYPDSGENGDALIRQADMAMYQSKMHKHNRTLWWQQTTH
jgi:diguanylate cyclase (GGDEF)-like protein/PAS domain S-box-containing protein